MRKKNTVIMSVSFLVAVLFIGTAITPVIASLSESISNVERVDAEAETDSATESEEIIDSAEQVESMTETEVADAEEGCSLCGDGSPTSGELTITAEGNCDTCTEAVEFAIEHMRIDMDGYLEDLLEEYGWYAFVLGDFVLDAIGSFGYWLARSGYEIELDIDELIATVQSYVEELVGPQQHLITLVAAALVAIALGIIAYFITICGAESVPGSASSAQSTSQETAQSSEVTAATIPINTIMQSTAYGSMGL